MDSPKPKLYLTRDGCGIFLWLSMYPPRKSQKTKNFQCPLCGWKMRIPESWYQEIIDIGECREYCVEALFAPS